MIIFRPCIPEWKKASYFLFQTQQVLHHWLIALVNKAVLTQVALTGL